MYIHFFTLFPVAGLAAVVAAVPSVLRARGSSGSQCNTGMLECCNSAANATDPAVAATLKQLGIDVSNVTGLVGMQCSPITPIAGSGGGCTQQILCCGNTYSGGTVAIDCTSVNS